MELLIKKRVSGKHYEIDAGTDKGQFDLGCSHKI